MSKNKTEELANLEEDVEFYKDYIEQLKNNIRNEQNKLKTNPFRRKAISQQINLLQQEINVYDSKLTLANSRITELRAELNIVPKEETKLEPKPEAQTSYQPKEEPNNKNQKPESKKDLNLKDYPKNQSEKDESIRDAENDFKSTEDKRKHKEKVQNTMESDILKSIKEDIRDISIYLNMIDESYSSKNEGIINTLENLKRKQGVKNPIFASKPLKNTLDIFGGPKYKAKENTQPDIITRPDSFEDEIKKLKENILEDKELQPFYPKIKLLRQIEQLDQSIPQVKSVQVAYETSTGVNKRKIPVLKIEEA